MSSQQTGFSKLTMLQCGSKKVDIDSGTLIFVCALMHKEEYKAGNYLPAVQEFQRQCTSLGVIYKWDFTMIFDGHPPDEKMHEHDRRSKRGDDSVIINSTYIAMCAKVCKQRYLNYIVSPSEADMQAGRRDKLAIPVCRDSDLIAYDNKIVVIVDSYIKETFRIINMNVPITDDIRRDYPLYVYYKRYGIKIIRWWAAVCGCDISENGCGISGAGKKCFMDALKSFDGKDVSSLTPKSFAAAIHKYAKPEVKSKYTVQQIEEELIRVYKWFSEGGTYYDDVDNIMSVSGRRIKSASRATHQHMNGELDPKTSKEFTPDQKKMIESVQPHNLLHNSAAPREDINGLSLPEGKATVDKCTVDELKAMVIARGGNVTGKDGKALPKPELVRIVRAYLLLEKQNTKHTVYFKRDRKNNGIFAKIDTSERKSVKQIVDSLVKCGEHEARVQRLFSDVQQLYGDGSFIEDFDTISLAAPEMSEDFIREAFLDVGEDVSQKNIVSGLTKVLEMDTVLYHAIAWSADKKSMFIVSKQRASMVRDEKTRHKTAVGEKPKLAEYLVMVQLRVIPTEQSTHGHTLGKFTKILSHYCAACKAGSGMCYHKSGCCWMQHLHWGEGRPTPMPATSKFASWIPGSRSARLCSTTEIASKQQRERLPTSNEEAQQKIDRGLKKSTHEGVPARYDVYGGNKKKRDKLSDPNYRSKERIDVLFKCLRASQSKK